MVPIPWNETLFFTDCSKIPPPFCLTYSKTHRKTPQTTDSTLYPSKNPHLRSMGYFYPQIVMESSTFAKYNFKKKIAHPSLPRSPQLRSSPSSLFKRIRWNSTIAPRPCLDGTNYPRRRASTRRSPSFTGTNPTGNSRARGKSSHNRNDCYYVGGYK